MTGTVDHPQSLWWRGRLEELLGLGQRRMSISRARHHQDRCAKTGNRANRLEVPRGDLEPWPQLDQLASRLLANEVLERGDIDEVMRDIPRAAPPRLKGADPLGIAAATAEHPLKPRTRGA